MPIRSLDDCRIKDLARDELVEVDRGIDVYLICQRLDRVIELLEVPREPLSATHTTPAPTCPNCGDTGPKDFAAGLRGTTLISCLQCHYTWKRDNPL